jgi:hypothetical protein
MAQPDLWQGALWSWASLELGEWIEAAVANFYLLHVWHEMLGRSRVRYVNMIIMGFNIDDEDMEIHRRNHFVPHDSPCAMAPVGFIAHHINHFFVVIFDYQRRIAHVLGRYISQTAMDIAGKDVHNWNDWRGPEYWRKIGDLHRWSTGDSADVIIVPVDWRQNGVDCGPIACSVLKQCMQFGLDEQGNLPDLEIQCGHKLRIHMLRVIAMRVKQCCSDYLMLLESPPDGWDFAPVDEDTISSIQNGRHQAQCLQLLRRLTVVSATCSKCQRSIVHDGGEHGLHGGESRDDTHAYQDRPDAEWSEDDDAMDMVHAIGKANLAKLLKANKQLSGSRNRHLMIPRAIGTHLELEPELPSASDIHDAEDLQRSAAASKARRRVKNWYLGSNKRFPRPTAPLPMAA